MEKQKYYITTAIAYTSGKPHIGNTYEAVLADAIARYKRLEGYDVFFQTGTDEHGQKIELKAEEAGITPKEFVDNVSGEIKNIWDLMNTSYDKFIRTTQVHHIRIKHLRIGQIDSIGTHGIDIQRTAVGTHCNILGEVLINAVGSPALHRTGHNAVYI